MATLTQTIADARDAYDAGLDCEEVAEGFASYIAAHTRRALFISSRAIVFCCLWAGAVAQASSIATIVGDGTRGFNGDGGAGTDSLLYNPHGVATDAAGNVYIADTDNNRVRLWNKSTFVVSTIVGNGIAGFSGDGSVGTSATMYKPSGVAVDAAGNVFIADTGNNRVRLWNKSTAIITTIVGGDTWGFGGDSGVGTSAKLNWPSDVAVDAAGNVFIADVYNHRVRLWNQTTAIVTTLLGNGIQGYSGDGGPGSSAALNSPGGVAVDSAGNVYVADTINSCVRLWNKSTTVVSTIVGDGDVNYRGLSGDGGAGTSANLFYPTGVAVDTAGNVYIADTYNDRVRLWNSSTANITTIVGSGNAGSGNYHVFGGDGGPGTSAALNSPSGVAVDAAGNVYIADTGSTVVRTWNKSTAIITTIAGHVPFSGDGAAGTSATLYNPSSVAVDASGNVYVADTYNNRVRLWNRSMAIVSTIVGNGYAGFSGDGGVGTDASLFQLSGIAVDVSGNVYIADTFNRRVRQWNSSTGIITTIVGNGFAGSGGDGGAGTSASFWFPVAVAVDASGNVFIADSSNMNVRLWNRSTAIITTIAGNGVIGYSGDGGTGTNASLSFPCGVAVDAAGNVYIADTVNSRVRMWNKSTAIITTIAGGGPYSFGGDGGAGTSASLRWPYGVAVDTAGNVYIADTSNNRVRMWNKSTANIATIVGNGNAGFSGDGGTGTNATITSPFGVAVDSGGNVYFADTSNDRVRMLSLSVALLISSSPSVGTTPTGTSMVTTTATPIPASVPTATRSATGTPTPMGTHSARQSSTASASKSGTRTPSRSPSATRSKSPVPSPSTSKSGSRSASLSGTSTRTLLTVTRTQQTSVDHRITGDCGHGGRCYNPSAIAERLGATVGSTPSALYSRTKKPKL